MPYLRRSAALLALLASQAAYADNISVRINFTEGRTGTAFTPIHAEVGTFAVTPDVRKDAEGGQWRVVAKDAAGNILHEVTVNTSAQRHIEVFNRKTGAIEMSQHVKRPSGVFEVSLPFDKNTTKVEVLPMASSAVGARAATAATAATAISAPLATFGRAALEQLVNTVTKSSKMTRAGVAAPPVTATTILNNGSSATKMDYVFVGDGYTAAEMGKWQADAQKVINGFLADPVFAANKNSMNIRRVDVASHQSGADEIDKGIYKDTAMDGEFGCFNIDRLLCVNSTKVYNIVGSVLPPDQRDVIIVIANSTRYGGSGGEIATLSMADQSIEIALHEIGHTAFALADEYEYGTCGTTAEPSEVNVSLKATRAVKWGSLISANTPVPTQPGMYANGTVGVFQGGQYCAAGKYRPTENSRMRSLGYPWHAVNEGAVRTVFAQYTGPAGATQSGTLASGGSATAPSAAPGYVSAAAGTYTMQLTGAAGTDFDLFLYKYANNAWVKVASSEGQTSTESISYNGTAGYYYAQVKSYSGTGTYTLVYNFPK